jgi:hypothetical protein
MCATTLAAKRVMSPNEEIQSLGTASQVRPMSVGEPALASGRGHLITEISGCVASSV